MGVVTGPFRAMPYFAIVSIVSSGRTSPYFSAASIHDYDLLEQHDKKNIDWFVVNWCLGNTCNYACSYCPTSLHDGSRKWHSLENVKAFVGRIKAIHPTKKIYFEFTGGEVTLNKDFIAICQFCHENDVKVGFISNGSRTIRWWEENKQHLLVPPASVSP